MTNIKIRAGSIYVFSLFGMKALTKGRKPKNKYEASINYSAGPSNQ
jgi:hypothetical protein